MFIFFIKSSKLGLNQQFDMFSSFLIARVLLGFFVLVSSTWIIFTQLKDRSRELG